MVSCLVMLRKDSPRKEQEERPVLLPRQVTMDEVEVATERSEADFAELEEDSRSSVSDRTEGSEAEALELRVQARGAFACECRCATVARYEFR